MRRLSGEAAIMSRLRSIRMIFRSDSLADQKDRKYLGFAAKAIDSRGICR